MFRHFAWFMFKVILVTCGLFYTVLSFAQPDLNALTASVMALGLSCFIAAMA